MIHFIENGGLTLPPQYSQVCEKSHKPLLEMNKLRYITHSSQDGYSDCLYEERSYVCGYLQNTVVEKFIALMTQLPNIVVINEESQTVHAHDIECSELYNDRRIAVTRQVQSNKICTAVWIQRSFEELFFSKQCLMCDDKDNEIGFNEVTINSGTFSGITCVDLRWGHDANGSDGLFTLVVANLKLACDELDILT